MDLRVRYEDIPWIMGGDFNMIKSLSEKKGGTRSLSKDSMDFQTFADNIKLVDTNWNTSLFTWNNRRGGDSLVALMVDRFFISKNLMLNGKEVSARVLPFPGSDH